MVCVEVRVRVPRVKVGVFIGVGLMWARKLRRRRLKWERRRAMTSLDVVHGDEGDEGEFRTIHDDDDKRRQQ